MTRAVNNLYDFMKLSSSSRVVLDLVTRLQRRVLIGRMFTVVALQVTFQQVKINYSVWWRKPGWRNWSKLKYNSAEYLRFPERCGSLFVVPSRVLRHIISFPLHPWKWWVVNSVSNFFSIFSRNEKGHESRDGVDNVPVEVLSIRKNRCCSRWK